MKRRFLPVIGIFLLSIVLIGCGDKKEKSNTTDLKKKQLLIYCGITMVKPMAKIAKEFEKRHNVAVKIIQGGSKDLYNSLKTSKRGDLYLPGSSSYRKNNLNDGFLGEYVFLGHNKASIVVGKGNPKNIKGNLEDLLNPDLNVVLCNPESGSIGKMTKKILTKAKIYKQATSNTKFLTTDSRNLTKAIRDGEADIVINWHATTMWPENQGFVQAIEIDEQYAKKKELLLNGLTFSKNPILVKEFLTFAGGEEGRTIFTEYGF
ncbi:MAG: substrate-binding domain-containing protein [Campylobacterales bacterium]|nr:substrate-binding domain-containing protein [Campylobacterales bacterium]